MNAYLGGLIARNLAPPVTAVRPRLRALFETPFVPGHGDSGAGAGLAEITVERLVEPAPVSPRRAAIVRATPAVAGPAEAAAPIIAPVTRSAAPPQAPPAADDPVLANREPTGTDEAPDRSTNIGFVRPPTMAPSPAVERGGPTRELPAPQQVARVQPAPPSPERQIVERATHTSERRTSIVERSTVAPPVTRPPVATTLAASRVATPLIASAPPARPSITVTIGRVDVRAVVAPSPPPQVPRPAPKPEAQSLEAYLRERSGGPSR